MNAFIAYKFGRRYGYVTLRYIATIFFFISQLATFITVSHYFDVATRVLEDVTAPGGIGELIVDLYHDFLLLKISGPWGVVLAVMRACGSLVIPLYFVSIISFVLNLNRDSVGGLTMRNAFLAFVFFLLEIFVLVIAMFLVSFIVTLMFDLLSAEYPTVTELLDQLNGILSAIDVQIYGTSISDLGTVQSVLWYLAVGFLFERFPSFNVFLDMFLCLATCFFLCFRPKWANTRGKLLAYRLLAILPIGYIAASFVLNGLIHMKLVEVVVEVRMALPMRSILYYFFFALIIICHRRLERPPMRVGEGMYVVKNVKSKVYGNVASLESRADGRRRSLYMATFLSVGLVLLCAVDFAFSFTDFGANWGLGKSYYAVFCVPFLFFFDAERPVEKKQCSVFSAIYFLVIFAVVVMYAVKLLFNWNIM